MRRIALWRSGALPGFAIAIAMLKLDWVDCENWDVFAVFAGREGEEVEKRPKMSREQKSRAKQAAAEAAAEQESVEAKRALAVKQFVHHVQHGNGMEALAVHVRMRHADSEWELTQQQRMALIKVLQKQKLWSESVAPMAEFVRDAPDGAPRVRLKLAQVLLVQENRPGRALDALSAIAPGDLPPELEKMRQKLETVAKKRYEEGELEIETDEW